ncbi:MAG: NUDIX hydrolase [Acutalibacteraceae bacterium]|nr:NUDIX hydrolase [Acutalibacteraceae bacterium]
MKEKIITSDYKFKGRVFKTRVDRVELENGHIAEREICEHNGGVCIAALNENNEILLIKQFRSPYSEVIWEIPAGKLEVGEDALECGMRELSEETGFTAQNWFDIGKLYPTPGYCTEILYTYLATNLTPGNTHPDEDEYVDTYFIDIDKSVEMVMSNEIKDGKTQAAILKVAHKIKNAQL